MIDHAKLQRQHLERTLVVAESSGDKEWAKAVRAELKDYEPEPGPEPEAQVFHRLQGQEDDMPVEPEPEPDEEPDEPAKSASKADWVDYAVSKGADREEAETSTKDELIAAYGS